MEFAQYEIPPGGASQRGASSIPWFARGAQPLTDPAWSPPPDVETDDPHTDAYSVGDGPPAVGPTAENVIGGDVGSVSGASFNDYTSADFDDVPDNIVLGE
jgi:hypothetical protein